MLWRHLHKEPHLTTFSRPSITRLRVEAFRGFRDAREFDLSADAVIVTGPNGTGKTSFFDALQWALVGSIERLESLRSRRNSEHVVNQYRLGRKASVEVDVELAGGLVTLRRTGDQGGAHSRFAAQEVTHYSAMRLKRNLGPIFCRTAN